MTVEGQAIGTTKEHPFYVKDMGWIAAASLKPGYLLRSRDNRWLMVQSVVEAGESLVYDLRVENNNFFVGGKEWGFSALVYAACRKEVPGARALALSGVSREQTFATEVWRQ